MLRRRRRRFAPAVLCLLSAGAAAALPLPSGAAIPAPAAAPVSPAPLRYRLVYLAQNLLVDASEAKAEAILRRAKAAGYNGAILADYKLGVLDTVPPHYFENAARLKAAARTLGMALYPAVAPFGYSDSLLAHDPDLAEGLPVRDAVFVVKGTTADAADAGRDLLPNGGFETASGDHFSGWDYQDAPGTGTFADHTVVHGGTASLRMQDIGRANAPSGNGRIVRMVDVQPFHQYHLSVWIKTDAFAAAGDVHTTILPVKPSSGGGGDVPSLCYNTWQIQPTQDWTEYHAVFNSLDSRQVRIYLGVWGGTTGRLWFDDAHLTETGLLNVVRRDGCPLIVRDAATGTPYVEGRDFAPVHDPRMGTVPWPGSYEVWHQPPALTLLPGSRIRDGQRLSVSFYHAVSVNDGQVTCCLAAPKAFTIAEDQIRRVRDLLAPAGYLLSHDEIRVAGWCADCDPQRTKHTPGQTLAANIARCNSVVRRLAPGAERFVWSDMFDPTHNAHGDYYLVNGSWAGSWEGLPKDVVVLNWNAGDKARDSLRFFAAQGNPQILAGYYDGRPESIRPWLAQAREAAPKSLAGVMYTTWQGRYDDLEAFANAAWGDAKKISLTAP